MVLARSQVYLQPFASKGTKKWDPCYGSRCHCHQPGNFHCTSARSAFPLWAPSRLDLHWDGEAGFVRVAMVLPCLLLGEPPVPSC